MMDNVPAFLDLFDRTVSIIAIKTNFVIGVLAVGLQHSDALFITLIA